MKPEGAAACPWVKVRSLGKQSGQGFVDIVTNPERPGEWVCKTLKRPEKMARMKREIAALRALEGSFQVVAIEDHGDKGGPRRDAPEMPWYVMPKHASSLEERVSRGTPYGGSVDAALRSFYELALGLRRIHERGMFHRDLKPDNIFVTTDGQLLFADFGLVWLPEELAARETETREQVGSRHYMPPECLEGRVLEPDEAADVYAMAKILAFMLRGEELFAIDSDSIGELPIQHADGESLRRCILAGIQRDREARKRGWSTALEAMRNILHPVELQKPTATAVIDPQRFLARQQAAADEKRLVQVKARFAKACGNSIGRIRRLFQRSEANARVQQIAQDLAWQFQDDDRWLFDVDPIIAPGEAVAAGCACTAWLSHRDICAYVAAFASFGSSGMERTDYRIIVCSAVSPVHRSSKQTLALADHVSVSLLLDDPRHDRLVDAAAETMLARWLEHVATMVNASDD